MICGGCVHAADVRDKKKASLCPFCRTPPPITDEKIFERYMKRMEVDNDPVAIHNIGGYYHDGRYGSLLTGHLDYLRTKQRR